MYSEVFFYQKNHKMKIKFYSLIITTFLLPILLLAQKIPDNAEFTVDNGVKISIQTVTNHIMNNQIELSSDDDIYILNLMLKSNNRN